MLTEEKNIVLKSGGTALLRNPSESDAQGLLDYLRITAGETDFLLRYPEECDNLYSLEGEKVIINRINSSENELMLLCEAGGEIAGVCNLSFNTRIKTRHISRIAIAVVKKYWRQGIGKQMMNELISIAESREEVLQIELEFIEGNHRARAMYESLGFRITCVRPNAFRLKDGTLLNEYAMARPVIRKQN